MEDLKLGVVETRFAELIWEHEPLGSRELANICQRELNWKRPTTYNVLRKLCDKGIFQNRDGIVSSVLSREEYQARRGEQFVSDAYGGSLPAFVAAFTARHRLSGKEADEIQRLIDEARGEG